MQAPIELQVDELYRKKTEIVEKALRDIRLPITEASKILTFAKIELQDVLEIICSSILEEEKVDLAVDSDYLEAIIHIVEKNIELTESLLIYGTGGIFPRDSAEKIILLNLLNAYNLECAHVLACRINFFVISRYPNSNERDRGTESLYNVIFNNKFDLADYLLSLDPDPKKTMNELENKYGLVKKMFETFNIPVFKWQLTKQPDLRWGIDLGVSYIQRFENSKNQLSKVYYGVRLQKKLEDANEFKNLIFKGLGYDLEAVNHDQLQCLSCSPLVKEEINFLAKKLNYNIISIFECFKGKDPTLHRLIIEHKLTQLSSPEPRQTLNNPHVLFAQGNFVKAFVEKIPFFDKLEQLDFKKEIMRMVKRINQKNKESNKPDINCNRIIEILKARSEVSRFRKDLDGVQFSNELNGWINVIVTHLQHGEFQTLEFLFFNSLVKNNIETVKVMAIAMNKAGWHLDKTDEKLVQCLQILKNSNGETAALKMLCALRPAFNTEESELAESSRLGR